MAGPVTVPAGFRPVGAEGDVGEKSRVADGVCPFTKGAGSGTVAPG